MFQSYRSRALLAAVLIAAPLCEVVEALLSPLRGTSTTADLVAISLHQGAFVMSVLVGLVGTVLYVPAFLGLAGVAARRSRVLAGVGAAFAVLSMLGFAGVRMAQAVELQGIRDGLAMSQLARLVDGVSANPIGGVLLAMFLGGTVVGVVCLAIATLRSRVAPWPAVVLFVVFPFADLLVPGRLGSVVAHGVLLVGLGWIGVAQLRTAHAAAVGSGADANVPMIAAEG